MELGVFFTFILALVLCAGLVFLFSFFGVQSETFEEALEKQRESNKEKKKEKKQTTEKKKKAKKGKEPKNNNVIIKDFDEDVLVEGSGAVVEPVFVEPVKAPVETNAAAPVEEKPKKETKKESSKKKEDKKKQETKVDGPVAAAAEPEDLSVKQKIAAVEKQAAAAVVEKVVEAKVEVVAAAAAPQKKKMEIQEVANVKADEAEEKKKKKTAKESKSKKNSNKSNYEEILAVIRKAALTSSEAQGIVDILLMKQTGKDDSLDGDDWIEPGKENEAKKAARQLADLETELEEEKSKSQTWEKKIQSIRKELSEARSVAGGHRREMEELTTKKNNEIATLNARLTQASAQVSSMTERTRQLESSQSQYTLTINNLQTQLSQQSAQPAADAQLSGDLEQLKNAKIELTAANTSLQQKFKTKCDEVEALTADKQQLAANLDSVKADKQQLETAVAAATQEKESLVQEKTALSAQLESAAAGSESQAALKQQFDSQLSTVTAAKTQLQLELSVLKEKMSSKEVENSRLMEENERLSEQVASSVERPAAEGEEAAKVNGHQEVPQEKVVADPWEEKYNEISLRLKQIESEREGAEKDLVDTKAQLAKLSSKNDTEVAAYSRYRSEVTGVLRRLVPSLTDEEDLTSVEKQAGDFIQGLEKSSSAASQVEELREEVAKLEAQAANYKTVLAQTENMLTTLQASVESAEGEWKKKLQIVESECREFKSATESLKSSNATLQSKLKELEAKNGDLERLEAELEKLAEQLESERDSKEALSKKCAELQELLAAGQKQINIITQQQNNGVSTSSGVSNTSNGGGGPKQGFVHVTVHQAADLMDKDIAGKSDPYVILQYNDHVVQSKVVENDLNPVFEFEEVFVLTDTKSFTLTLKDKDIGKDELLGCTEIDFSSVLGGSSIRDQWIDLDKAKKGRVQVSVKFSEAQGGVPNGYQEQA